MIRNCCSSDYPNSVLLLHGNAICKVVLRGTCFNTIDKSYVSVLTLPPTKYLFIFTRYAICTITKAQPISRIYAIPFRLVTGSKHLSSTNLPAELPGHLQDKKCQISITLKSNLNCTKQIRCNTILFNFYSSQKVIFISRDERVSIFPMKIFVKLSVGCRLLYLTETITLGRHDSLIEELSIS